MLDKEKFDQMVNDVLPDNTTEEQFTVMTRFALILKFIGDIRQKTEDEDIWKSLDLMIAQLALLSMREFTQEQYASILSVCKVIRQNEGLFNFELPPENLH